MTTKNTTAAVEVFRCLMCGDQEVDAEGWKNGAGETGPQCMQCGATGESVERWNNRDWLIDHLTAGIDGAIRKSKISTHSELQSLIESLVTR